MRGKEMGRRREWDRTAEEYKEKIGKECKQGMERTKDKEKERIGMENNVRNRSHCMKR
jgi:hypothetical protein